MNAHQSPLLRSGSFSEKLPNAITSVPPGVRGFQRPASSVDKQQRSDDQLAPSAHFPFPTPLLLSSYHYRFASQGNSNGYERRTSLPASAAGHENPRRPITPSPFPHHPHPRPSPARSQHSHSTSSSLNFTSWISRICLSTVLLPEAPAPRSRSLMSWRSLRSSCGGVVGGGRAGGGVTARVEWGRWVCGSEGA